MYSKEEVEKATLEYFGGDQLATNTFITKYALSDAEGNLLEKTPTDMHHRLAKEFARIEARYPNPMSEEEIFELLEHFKYLIPGGSVMAGLGNKNQITSLSNCVVLPQLFDSYGGILFADQQLIQLAKRRCGIGLDLSTLRPRGMHVTNAAGTSSGVASFMERFSNSVREVATEGRRGALMLSIHVSHPSIEEFVEIKKNLTKVTGANISVRLSDEFMYAVEQNTDFELKFPIDSKNPIVSRKIKARKLWNKIIQQATTVAEPGLMFDDHQHWYSTSSVYPQYKNITGNPCVVGSTIIDTNAGKRTVKELADNNLIFKVKCFDEKKNEIEFKTAKAFKTKSDAKVLRIKTKTDKVLMLTPEHLIFSNRGWIRADQLTAKDKILALKEKANPCTI